MSELAPGCDPDGDVAPLGAGRVIGPPLRTTNRRGRMSGAKRDALHHLAPAWSATEPVTAGSLAADFGRDALRLLDVGVGNGEATRAWAHQNPDCDVVAVELHLPGLARLVRALHDHGPDNVRVLEADVTTLLAQLSDNPGAFNQVRVLFPDPWPKRRHHHRRLVDPTFVTAVTDLLPVGGRLHLATDWDDYAVQMRSALGSEPRLRPVLHPDANTDTDIDTDIDPTETDPTNTDPAETEPAPVPAEESEPEPDREWTSPRPDRPVTTYEGRGRSAGRRIIDLVSERVS